MVRILVIDDDRQMRTACSRVLSMAGWAVLCAEDGPEGLHTLAGEAEKIDLVLLDQLLPGMSGLEVLAQIHAIDPHLPVIIMTGSATDDSAMQCRRQGARDCLAKPFTPEQLRELIRRILAEES